jgi:hypothetical protein
VGYADPQMVHLPIAHYYDIPYISYALLVPADKRRRLRADRKGADVRMKRMVFDHYLRYPQSLAKAFFQPDMLHPNARGHVR